MKKIAVIMSLIASLVPWSIAAGFQLPGDVTEGMLVLPGDSPRTFPLRHTFVDAEISGFVADVTVIQEFENDLDVPMEAVYVFPLPDKAAVNRMKLTVGDAIIEGVIKRRTEAEKIYRKAKHAGRTAALLTQERPNIFTQSIANIPPGETIHVEIHYIQDLKYDHGEYVFNFPMVVGPRFIPGNPVGRSGNGWAPDTDTVPDASRITPPVLPPEWRSGHDISLTLQLDAGVPVEDIQSPSHAIRVTRKSESCAEIALDSEDKIPNKDFILRYKVAGDCPRSALLTHAGEHGGFFTLMIQPQADWEAFEIVPKEMIFVVDCSGSMQGKPMEKAKELMKKCISEMNPADRFQIIRFSTSSSRFAPGPVDNTPGNVARALRYIDGLRGMGGTMMLSGIRAALSYPTTPGYLRTVLFLTDGYIGNETEILSAVRRLRGNARLFSLGVGSSVNHYLLDRMAVEGRGFTQYVRPDEDTSRVVTRFYERIRNPLITNIQIDWGDVQVTDVYPVVIPDLFSSQPVIIHGRYSGESDTTITITGEIRSGKWEQRLHCRFPEYQEDNEVQAVLWARRKVQHLMMQMYEKQDPEIVGQMTELALRYSLMTKYTAFVAVSEKRVPGAEHAVTSVVPVEMPEYTRFEAVFGKPQSTYLCKKSPAPPASIGWRAKGEVQDEPGIWGFSEDEVDCDDIEFDHHVPEGGSNVKTAPLSVRLPMVSGDVPRKELARKLSDEMLLDMLARQGNFRRVVFRVAYDADIKRFNVSCVERGSASSETIECLQRILQGRLFIPGCSGEVTVVLERR